MNKFQRYLFSNVLRMMLTIVGGLVTVALLTQGLTQLDPIVETENAVNQPLELCDPSGSASFD